MYESMYESMKVIPMYNYPKFNENHWKFKIFHLEEKKFLFVEIRRCRSNSLF